jgi:hypothetical protein
MKTTVVLTTIHKRETTAIPLYESRCKEMGWDFVVVGDKKTPPMSLSYGIYLSPEDQTKLPFKLSELLPWNCYERKNIGYLYAHKILGTDCIISTDDDNYPIDNWPSLVNNFRADCKNTLYAKKMPFANPLPFFSNQGEVWARGIPLSFIKSYSVLKGNVNSQIKVIAGLWDGSPDFDALGHIFYDHIDWKFKPNLALLKARHVFSPYNTQNTAFTCDIAKYQFLCPQIGRSCDIWASYLSQRVMQSDGQDVLFVTSTVEQKRNIHDYRQDIIDEKTTLLQSEEFVERLQSVNRKNQESSDDYYMRLCEEVHELMPLDFIKWIECWLKEMS